MASRNRGRRSYRPRARYQWITNGIDPTSLTQNQAGITSVGSTLMKAGWSLVRTIISVGVEVSSNDLRGHFMWAFYLMTEEALTASVIYELQSGVLN